MELRNLLLWRSFRRPTHDRVRQLQPLGSHDLRKSTQELRPCQIRLSPLQALETLLLQPQATLTVANKKCIDKTYETKMKTYKEKLQMKKNLNKKIIVTFCHRQSFASASIH